MSLEFQDVSVDCQLSLEDLANRSESPISLDPEE